MSREYPPDVYGGAGVHVEYLSRELAKKIEVEVHCWGDRTSTRAICMCADRARGLQSLREPTEKFKTALETLSLNLAQMVMLEKVDVVHTHTWYVSMAGFLAKTLFDVPFVLTTHSLEPLRAWKAEQLGSGYRMSSWIERTAIHDADAIVAVSKGTKEDILKAYPDVDPDRIHVIYNGIDLDQYQKTTANDALVKYGVDPTLPYVLFVGRITRQKGVTHLVDAIAYMPKNTQVVLCAGAPDTPEIAAEMREQGGWHQDRQSARGVDREDGFQSRGDPALQQLRACSAARQSTSRSGSSTWRRWRAARRWWPALRVEFWKWWWITRRVTWCISTRIR